MELDDGFMIRIRPWLGTLSAEQAKGLANLAARFGAGGVELTNRANLQLRGLARVEYDALLPKLEELDLTRVDRTPSGRVNTAIEPLRAAGSPTHALAEALSDGLSTAEFAPLPQKFGFVLDPGPVRVMADIVGDIRIEASGANLLVRAAGRDTGVVAQNADDAVALALNLARWFINSGAIGADGRGRMGDAMAQGLPLPAHLTGEAVPNPPQTLDMSGPSWIQASGETLSPDRLAEAARAAPLHVSPFRALYAPGLAPTDHLETPGQRRDNASQPAQLFSGRA